MATPFTYTAICALAMSPTGVNAERSRGTAACLLGFPNDLTPSRTTYIDPNAVVRVYDDRY
jgi:hypothetical protein